MTSTTGIMFVPFTKVQLSYKDWKLVYYYDLNKYYEEVEVIEHFYFRLNEMCGQASISVQDDFANTCHLAIIHAKSHLDKIVENRNIIESYNSYGIRKRRAPLNLVGSLASSLFGVLDQADAERYSAEISKIKADQSHQSELLKKQTLITERLTQSTNTTLNDIIFKLNDMNKSLNNLIENKDWTAIRQNFNTMATTLALILIDHDQITMEIKSILSHALKGEIIDLIPTDQLEENLYFINDNVARNEELAIHFQMESIYNIFKTASIHSVLKNNLVIIEIGLPIIEMEEFDIFRAIPVPTRVNNSFVTIMPSSNMFISNNEKTQYIPLSEQEFNDCMSRDSNSIICKQNEPIHNGEDNTCELMLLSKPYMKSLPQNCEIRTVPAKNYIIYLHEPNKFFCVVKTPIEFQTICPNKSDTFKIENSGILQIHNDCYIKNENFIIKAHSTNQYTNKEVINPKFNLSEIIKTTNARKPDGKSEIFIKDHFSDFNAIADDVSKLEKEEEDQLLLENHENQIKVLNISTSSVMTILTLIIIVFIGLKMKKYFTSFKQNNTASADIEMQANNIHQSNDNYAEIQRAPTPFIRRSLRKTTE